MTDKQMDIEQNASAFAEMIYTEDGYTTSDVISAYLAGYNEAAKWISTLIELPEPGVDVLAEFEFGIAIGRRSGNIILDDQAGYQATYWQPISKR